MPIPARVRRIRAPHSRARDSHLAPPEDASSYLRSERGPEPQLYLAVLAAGGLAGGPAILRVELHPVAGEIRGVEQVEHLYKRLEASSTDLEPPLHADIHAMDWIIDNAIARDDRVQWRLQVGRARFEPL